MEVNDFREDHAVVEGEHGLNLGLSQGEKLQGKMMARWEREENVCEKAI
jgi:hypothetical protein